MEGGKRYDLLFLDIQFSSDELNGLDAGYLIRDALQDYATSIVYISWEERYARQLFPVRPLYFIVKPLCRKEVEAAVALYLKFANEYGSGGHEFTYKKGHTAQSVRLKDIVYLESHKHKIRIHFANGACDEFYGTLKELYAEQLKAADFLFIHASYAVNYDYITVFAYNALSVTGSQTLLPVARNRRDEVRQQYAAIMERRRLV